MIIVMDLPLAETGVTKGESGLKNNRDGIVEFKHVKFVILSRHLIGGVE